MLSRNLETRKIGPHQSNIRWRCAGQHQWVSRESEMSHVKMVASGGETPDDLLFDTVEIKMKWTQKGDQWMARGTLGNYIIRRFTSGWYGVFNRRDVQGAAVERKIDESRSLENAKTMAETYDGYRSAPKPIMDARTGEPLRREDIGAPDTDVKRRAELRKASADNKRLSKAIFG